MPLKARSKISTSKAEDNIAAVVMIVAAGDWHGEN
jgi:hypothetical protein